jgi:hypothetical protein
MQELEELVKSAKLDGFSQDEFTKALLRNPKYKGVNPEQIASAWGSGVKKKDQPLAPSSPGAKTASTESPLQSGSKEQPTPSTSELEPAPSLSRAAGLRDVDSRYGPVLSALPEQERTKLETGKGIPKSVTGAERKLNELKAGSYTALGNLLSIQNSAAEQIAMGLKSIGVPEDVASTLESSIKSSGGFYNPYAGELRDVLVKYNTKMAEDIKAKNDAYNMSFDEALERGEIGEALDIATGAFVESLPQMAAIVAAGATTGPLGAGVYGQVSSFDSYKRQLMRDYGIDEDQAKKVAFGLATVEGAMDGLTGGMAKFGAKAIKDLGKEAGEKAIKGFAQKVISNPAAVFLGGSLGEAGTEAATQLGQNAILKATVDPELDLMNGVKLAGAAGLIGGGTFSTPVVIASTVGKVSDIKKRNEVNKKIDELSIALDNGEIPSYMTEEVKAQRDALVAEKRKMFTDDLEFYNSMSEDDRNKVTDINTKIKSLSDDIKSGKVTRDSFEAVRDVAKNLIVEKQNIEQKYVSQEGKQVPGTEQGGEAVVQAEPVEGAGKKETPAGRVLQAPEKTVGTVRGLLNRRATFSDPVSETIVEGDVYQDGQRVVIETEEGKIFDIGNIDEIQDRPTSELGLSEAKGRISVNEDGSFTYNGGDNQKIQGGTVMINRQTGLKSIKRGKDGSIKNVSLTSPDGTETYNLKGQDAVDAAYQIMLNFSTSPEQSARVEQMLQQNEKARREIESARVALEQTPETTTEEAVGDTVDDTVGGDGPRVGGVVGKQATTQEIKARTASDPQKGSLYNAVRRASKTLSSIIPDATYVFVDSDAEAADYYKANMADVDAKENGSDKGRIFQNKNTGKVEIVINTSKADAVTAYHELFHAAFFRVYAQDAKTAIDFSNRLAKVLESGTASEKAIAKRVKDHVSKYEGDADAVVSEEFLAELAGIMTSDAKSITQGMASKLANFFNKIAKAMGMDPVFKEAATTKEVVDFMNSFAKAASTGSSFNPVFNEVLTGTFRPSSSKSVGNVDPKAKRENLERSKNFPTQTVSSMDYDGETVLTTQSDRLAAGSYTLPSGEKVELKGGFGYPAQTKKVWAASKLSKAAPLVGQINRQIKERGYALVAPVIMSEVSHKSNYTYFSVAMKLINQAADKKKLSNKAFLDQVKNAGKKAGVDLSDVNAQTVKENTDILLDKFSVESGAFESRKAFITELLGNTTPGGKNNAKLNGVVTSDQLAAMLADPILDGMPRGSIVSLIKVTKPVVARKTSIEKDGFLFHESYPAVIESEEGGIEMILIDDAQLAMEAIPVAETTNGKIVSLAAREGDKNKYATDLGLSNMPGVSRGTLRVSEPTVNKTQQDGKETKRPAAGNRLFNEPLKAVKSIADKYFKGAFGTERPTFEGTRTLDKARAKRISDAFDAMKHSPNDPEVAAAYEALSKETVDQYNAFLDAGYTVEINNEEPYANSQEMIDDLRKNKRIKIFSTESGFGDTPITAKQRKENPLLDTTKFKDVNGEPMLINDLFRAVHDFYGHAELGNSFGPLGEENAWNVHARMFSPLARRAMTSETRGQNSYVNFSGVNEKADKLREKARKLRDEGKIEEAIKVAEEIYEITSFADQKIGLLPEEFSQIDGFEARSSKFDGGKKSFSKSELDELDNSPYTKSQIEAIINKGKYALMSAENPQAANTVEDNDARTARAEEWLTERGYGNYTKIYGVFENKENSFLVPDMTMEDAEAFRKEFDQVSVAHSDGYMYEGGVDPRDEKANEFGIDYTDPKNDNYSIIKDSEGNAISFRTSYKWGTKEDLDKAIAKSNKKSRPSVDAMIIVDELATEGAVKPTAMQKVKDNALRAFVLTPEQQLVRSYKETQQSMVGRAGKKIRVQAEALNKLLGKNDELRLAVTAYLSGDLANSYDIIDKSPKGEQIFDLLTDMRAFVDSMSSDLTTSPSFMALPDALKATIQTNIGTYLRTSYRFWKDKNYTIDKAMRREAIAHQFDSNIAYELDKLLKEGMSPDDAEVKINSSRDKILRKAEKQIDEYIAEIERIRNTPEFKASGVVTSGQIKIPSDQLSGKKTVPEYIQQLLGVEKDPVVRFVDTAVALANIKYKGEMVYKIVTSLGADSIKTADQVTDGQIKSREFIKVNDKFSPLNDMYVHKDVFDVINNEDIYSSDIAWIQGYFNILKLSRKSKVIYNSPTWRKNITGGWQIMLANGVINTSTITDLINRAKFLAGKEDPEVTALLDRMAEFGLVGTDVNADIVGNLNSIYVSSLTGDTKLLEKASSYIKSADAKLGEKYSAIDDYTKMVIFRNKRDNAANKMFGKPFSELTEAEQYKSDAALAEEIKSTTPTFSRLPPLYKKIAKFPVGDFLSFKLEAARSISNVFITAVEDIKKSTDPKLSSVQRKAYAISGVSKLMGASTALSMAYVVPAMLSSMFLGDDEELYEDALKLRANWMDGHNLVVKKVYPDGRIAYYDLSMEDTYGDITNTIFQLSNGELEGAIKSLAADVQPNMAVELLVSIFTGKNEYAGDLYESYDPLYTKALKLAGHSIKSTIAPPSAYSSGRDASKAVEDNPELNWTQEFLTRFVKRIAVRDYESNAGKQFYYIVKESSNGITKDEQYTKLKGDARENRFEALSDMREEYLALTKISQYYGNKDLKSNAKSAVKRYLNKDEEAYVLRGKMK